MLVDLHFCLFSKITNFTIQRATTPKNGAKFSLKCIGAVSDVVALKLCHMLKRSI